MRVNDRHSFVLYALACSCWEVSVFVVGTGHIPRETERGAAGVGRGWEGGGGLGVNAVTEGMGASVRS